jgi:L-methionine (R)-S-oxide reductase
MSTFRRSAEWTLSNGRELAKEAARAGSGSLSDGENPALPTGQKMEKQKNYDSLKKEIKAVLGDELDPIVWMATLACMIRNATGHFWVGFYRVVDGELAIGPYQGTLGCLRIAFDRGVCGACATRKETIIVPDVHEFPGHIACDAQSQSEIVAPVFDRNGKLRAVLDIDSTERNAFDDCDRENLELIVDWMRDLKWPETT